MFNNLSRNEKLLAALLTFLAISGLAEGEPGLFVLLIILGIVFALRNANQSSDKETELRVVRRERPAHADQVHDHALEAVRRAGIDPDSLSVLPVDIGLISYHGDEEPVIHRRWPVEDDCDYIQPFVQLRVPVTVSGRVRFEMRDNTGQPVFVHEDDYQLERGRNLIIPASRLPIHDEQEMDGNWEMLVSAHNVLLARYRFEWTESERGDLHRHIAEDGEISSELRAILAESRLEQMSLDELLAQQEEDAQAYEGRR